MKGMILARAARSAYFEEMPQNRAHNGGNKMVGAVMARIFEFMVVESML